MSEKQCFKCLEVKPLEDFYKHKKMADGHLNKCKECTKRDANQHRAENLEKIREYDRSRSNLPHRKELRARVGNEWRENHPDRYAAGNAVSNALRDGKLTKPDICSSCGCDCDRIEGHHHDYAQPLNVTWVCKPCHWLLDQERRVAEE